MVIPSMQDDLDVSCAEGLPQFSQVPVPLEAPPSLVQRSSGSGAKPNATRHVSSSNKNPFACVPREMRNNQLRTNLAAVAEQFNAVSNGQTSASGSVASPTARTRRFSADIVNHPQQTGRGSVEGCQVTRAQSLQTSFTAQLGNLPPHVTGLEPSLSLPAYGCLASSPHVASCSPTMPSMALGSCLYSSPQPPPPPPPTQQLANQHFFNSNSYLQSQCSNSRSGSFELQFGRLTASSGDSRHNSVDLSPYMVHQMQLQQQLQQLQIQQEQAAAYAGLSYAQQQMGLSNMSAHSGSEPLPHMNLAASSSHSQVLHSQQQYMLSQPLMLNAGGGPNVSASTPYECMPAAHQHQQQQVKLSASTTLPPLSVTLPLAPRPAGNMSNNVMQRRAVSMGNNALQQLQFDQQAQQVVQQHLLQLSGEF